jgi:hypothetical protein
MSHNGSVTDMYPPSAPEQHDTTAIPRPYPPTGEAPRYAPGQGPGYDPRYAPGFGAGYAPGYVPGNPAADAWETKYRSQRTRTRIAVAIATVTAAAALIMGFATWQLSQNPLLSAASDLASGDLNLDGLVPPATSEDTTPGTTPNGSQDGTTPDAPSTDGLDIPLSELPLPEGLQSLASTLGITDVGQLLDLAVANGILSQEDADNLRAGIAAGALANGLTQGQDQSQ